MNTRIVAFTWTFLSMFFNGVLATSFEANVGKHAIVQFREASSRHRLMRRANETALQLTTHGILDEPRPSERIGDISLRLKCQFVANDPVRYRACLRLYAESQENSGEDQHDGKVCFPIVLGKLSVLTGAVGRDLELFSPFFSDSSKSHYYAYELKVLGRRPYAVSKQAMAAG
jgi:hypothetical protein